MNTEATTLYKLMILYMLSKVNFPLSNSQISEFMLNENYTNYFTLQEVLNSLADDEFITVLSYRNSTQYRLNPKSKENIEFFNSKLSAPIREDIDLYLRKNQYLLRNEIGVVSDYYKSTSGDYVAHCLVKEGDSSLIELNLSVPLKEQAEVICDKWRDSSQDIYNFVIQKLL